MCLLAAVYGCVGDDGGGCPLKVMGPQHVGAIKDFDPDPSFCGEEIKPGRAQELRDSLGKQGRGPASPCRLMLLAMHRDAADTSCLQECCPRGFHRIPKGCDFRGTRFAWV